MVGVAKLSNRLRLQPVSRIKEKGGRRPPQGCGSQLERACRGICQEALRDEIRSLAHKEGIQLSR